MPSSADLATSPVLLIDDTVLELLPAAVCVCDQNGTIVRFNRKAVELWGRTPEPDQERFCGAHRLFQPDGAVLPLLSTPMAAALRGDAVHDCELIMERPDGGRSWVLANVEPVRNAAGVVTGAINCFHDITSRKDRELRAEDDEELLSNIVEATPECVKIVSQDGSLLRMNSAGLRMIQAPSWSAVRSRQVVDLVAPEYRAAWEANHRAVCNGAKLTWEFEIIGLQGTRRQMESHAVPLRLPDGARAQLAVTREITERVRSERALRDSERHFRELLEALPAAVYTTDAEGRLTFYNAAAVELWGRAPELGQSSWCGAWRLFRPDGSPLPHDECPMAVAIKQGRALRGEEAIAERPDGRRVSFAAYPTPLRNAAGALVGAVNMMVDMTRRNEAEERRRLLVNELNHRVKNALSTVQSIAIQSLRPSSGTESFQTFESRLLALAKAHDVLTRESWQGATVCHLVKQACEPWGLSRFDMAGPSVRLPPKIVLATAMALHELGLNAVKFGALSGPDGRVRIEWDVSKGEEGRRLHLLWKELGGPPVTPPQHRGYGSRLLERGLALELGAEVRLIYAPDGLVCELHVPLAGP